MKRLNGTIFKIANVHTGELEIKSKIVFEDISMPGMKNAAYRIIIISNGAAMKGIDMEKIKNAYSEKGFE